MGPPQSAEIRPLAPLLTWGKLRPGGIKRFVFSLLAPLESDSGFPNLYQLAKLGSAAVTNKAHIKVSQLNRGVLQPARSAVSPSDSP